jgi:hypothetical protein
MLWVDLRQGHGPEVPDAPRERAIWHNSVTFRYNDRRGLAGWEAGDG